jgi:hypothetical protein
VTQHVPRHAVGFDPAISDAVSLSLPNAEVVRCHPTWWDGAIQTSCLMVRLGRQRYRLVRTGGQTLVLPVDRRQARRALARWRQGQAVLGAVPAPRTGAEEDVLTCPRCGALRSLGVDSCPRCQLSPKSVAVNTAR